MWRVLFLTLLACAWWPRTTSAQLDLGDGWTYHTAWAHPKSTNELHIPSGTTFQLIDDQSVYVRYRQSKDTGHPVGWMQFGGSWKIVTGPALIEFHCTDPNYAFPLNYRTRTNYHPPDKTVVIPPGQGGLVTLQCSSNLVDWVTTTNSLHTNVPSMKFFRVHVERTE